MAITAVLPNLRSENSGLVYDGFFLDTHEERRLAHRAAVLNDKIILFILDHFLMD